ncbi:Ig-like domain-containing protein [Brevibacillus sp. H7]|uniref:Ig-like domain-containing protein n=1 Tax=Brevibacillus sp. H7 TaxID=3349138 RepID=UPI0037FD60BA
MKKTWTSKWMAWGLSLCLLLGTGGYASAKDEQPPGMKAVPAHGERDVRVTSPLQIVFGEPVKLASGETVTSKNAASLVQWREADSRQRVEYKTSWSPSKKTLTLKPIHPLAYGTEYVITVPAGTIIDAAGNQNEAYTVRWRTEQELPPLQVTFSPADQLVDVPQGSLITLTFNKPMRLHNQKEITAKSVENFIKLTNEKNRRTAYSAAWDALRNTITLDPHGNLEGGTRYTVTLLEKKLVDQQRNKNQQFSSSFTTQKPVDLIAPQATITPAHGARQVSLDTKITLQFAEEVVLPDGSPLSSKMVENLVQITDEKGASVATYSTWNKNKRTLTVKPRGKWQAYTTYRVFFSANQVKDMSGNYNQPQMASFTTSGR